MKVIGSEYKKLDITKLLMYLIHNTDNYAQYISFVKDISFNEN